MPIPDRFVPFFMIRIGRLLLWSIYFCVSFEYGFIIFSILLIQDLHCSECYISNTVSSVTVSQIICDYYTYAILPSFTLFLTVGCTCGFFFVLPFSTIGFTRALLGFNCIGCGLACSSCESEVVGRRHFSRDEIRLMPFVTSVIAFLLGL